ncbi:2,3-dihydroxybenzoate decarboxylase [Seiridium cupressi]
MSARILNLALALLVGAPVTLAQYAPQEVIVNSGRPTFFDQSTSVPGKIAIEEHVGNTLFSGTFTTPFVNWTTEVNFDKDIYMADVTGRINNIDSRVAAMDAANVSLSILQFGSPGIQGVFNTTFAIEAAAYVNDELSRVYKNGDYSGRFGFWCSNALQDPPSAAVELERCVSELGGVGSFVVELDVPIYLHPRTPPPGQQRVYEDYNFLAGSAWGFSSETAAHVLRLMVSGIFDKYPTLKIILGHCGEGLPFYLPRINHRLRHFTPYWAAQQSLQYY